MVRRRPLLPDPSLRTLTSAEEISSQLVTALEQNAAPGSRGDVSFLVVARSVHRRPFLATGTSTDRELVESVVEASATHAETPWEWGSARNDWPTGSPSEWKQCRGIPIGTSLPPSFTGHIVLLGRSELSPETVQLAEALVPEVVQLVYGHFWAVTAGLQLGTFRHALLGPVQGLASAARALVEVASRRADRTEEVAMLSRRIELEVNEIRRWREISRVAESDLFGEPVYLRPRRGHLGPLLQRILHRFQPLFSERDIQVELKTLPVPEPVVEFDENAVDLLISEALNNAAKYGLRSRPVVVQMQRSGRSLELVVENVAVAPPDPPPLWAGRSGRGSMPDLAGDPLNPLPEYGGLYIAQRLAKAHGGALSTEVRRLGETGERNEVAFKVKVAVRLPLAENGREGEADEG